MSLIDFLRELPYFARLPEDDLVRICRQARELEIPPGETLLEEGTKSEAMYVVLDGEFEVTQRSGGKNVELGRVRAGEVLGEMALLENVPRSASARAVRPSRVAEITSSSFRELLENPSSVVAMLHTVTERLRAREAALVHSEKLAALGTMTAGLMHELNNPAAAVRRAAAGLAGLLDDWQLAASRLEPDILVTAQEAEPSGPSPTGLERADRREALIAALDSLGVPRAASAAAPLVDAGWEKERLVEVMERSPEPQRGPLLDWLALRSEIRSLFDEIRSGAERISDLVGSVKSYAYLDQAPIQEVDIHEGLEDTLVILRHKTGSDVKILRDFSPEPPKIEGYGRELNQVWTNLLDNALDAVGDSGTIHISTGVEDDSVVVEVRNDGPEIPPEIRERLFEPFFTTKSPGQGTGLGLHTSYRIVDRHGGSITCTSKPDETVFRVELPRRLPRYE